MDLLLASLTTIVGGAAVMELWFRVKFPGNDAFAVIGVMASIAAGPLIMWRRGTKPLIPIASIYCVLMFFVLLFISFDIAWRLGKVDL